MQSWNMLPDICVYTLNVVSVRFVDWVADVFSTEIGRCVGMRTICLVDLKLRRIIYHLLDMDVIKCWNEHIVDDFSRFIGYHEAKNEVMTDLLPLSYDEPDDLIYLARIRLREGTYPPWDVVFFNQL